MPKTKDEPVFDALLQQMVMHEHDIPQITQSGKSSGGGGGSSSTVTTADIYNPATIVVAPIGYTHKADYYTDGISDQVEINQAIIDVNALGGGIVLVKAGNYSISGFINILSNTTLKGEGVGTYIKIADNLNIHGIIINAQSHIVICDLYFDGNGQTATGGDHILRISNNSSYIDILRCKLVNAPHHIINSILDTALNSYIRVIDCELSGNGVSSVGGAGGTCVALRASNSMVKNCWITDSQFCGIELYHEGENCSAVDNFIIWNGVAGSLGAIQIGINHPNAIVRGNKITGNGVSGKGSIKVAGCNDAIVEGNTIYDLVSGFGIDITLSGINNTIVDNTIYGLSEEGIILQSEQNNILNNTIHECKVGIYIKSASIYSSINGNTVGNSWNQGILTQLGGSYFTIHDNKVFNSGQDGLGISDGIYLQVGNCSVQDNRCFDNQVIKTQRYGIRASGTNVDNCIIANNDLLDNASEGLSRFNTGSNNRFVNNIPTISGNNNDTNFEGYLSVGSASLPNNTSAGDITGTRIDIGSNSTFSATNGWLSHFEGTLVDTSGTAIGFSNISTLNPISDSSSQFRNFYFSTQVLSTSTINFTNGTGIVNLYSESRTNGSGNILALSAGLFTNVVNSLSASITNAFGIQTQPISTTALSSGIITTGVGLKVNNSLMGSGGLILTTQIGIDIGALTSGRNNIGLRIAAPSGGLGTSNYAIQLSDTNGLPNGGITFGTDVQLYRSAANTLKTDDSVVINFGGNVANPALSVTRLTGIDVGTATGIFVDVVNAGYIGSAVGIDIDNITGAGANVGIRVAAPSGGSTNYAIQLSDAGGTAAGGITFGTDTTLYRSAADTLKTDDKLVIAGELNPLAALNHDGTFVGLYAAAPVAQATTAGSAATFVSNTSLTADDSATWDGYTIGQVVKALRNIGILA